MAARESPDRPGLRLGAGAVLVVVVAVLAVTIGIGVWRSAAQPVERLPAAPSPSATAQQGAGEDVAGGEDVHSSAASAEIYVHVFGHVNRPGLYVLDAGSRVVDAVAAAGGFSPDAERGAANLARVLDDGEQLGVPKKGDAAPGGPAAGDEPDEPGAIDLNDADATELETLPGIGPAIAERILTWREENGDFASVDDLLAVTGIGPKTLESLRPRVTV